MIDAVITGHEELAKLFTRLTKTELAKAARKATREANKQVTLPAAVRGASAIGGEMGGLIAQSLTVRSMTKLKKGHYGTKVIIKPSDQFVYYSQTGKRYFIPTAIEYGHAFPGRGGIPYAPKDVAPRPFMRSAYEAKRRAASAVAMELLRKNIEAYVRANKTH